MSNASSPRRKRGHAGRAARTRFVELENSLAAVARPAAGGLVIEAEGLRLILADRAAVAILADLFEIARPARKGGRP
ncbi:MAG: hypothetical protein K9N23_16760 [Akkermansiaceae bacterium]|nr:hypothetical protein [Akkermansiaceae bacterium]MCF7733343.1 hypothetical protein [Akkermansiaceae bacterium]